MHRGPTPHRFNPVHAGTERDNDYSLFAVRYERSFQRAAWRILGDRTEADDVVQSAHLKALSHLHQFSGRAALSTWVTQIIMNEARTRLRQRLPSIDLDGIVLCSKEHNPEQEAARQQLRIILAAAIARLPAKHRTVFLLRECRELSTAETAERLGESVDCIKTRLHRAKAFLRKRLRSHLSRGEHARAARAGVRNSLVDATKRRA